MPKERRKLLKQTPGKRYSLKIVKACTQQFLVLSLTDLMPGGSMRLVVTLNMQGTSFLLAWMTSRSCTLDTSNSGSRMSSTCNTAQREREPGCDVLGHVLRIRIQQKPLKKENKTQLRTKIKFVIYLNLHEYRYL